MSVKLEWVPSIEASDRRKAGWVEVLLYGGAFVAPGCFLMASPVEEEVTMGKAPGSGDSDRARGLYNKFSVMRSDGSSAFGKKHHGCEYFVLDLTHDKFAWPALHAYAVACADEFPALSGDLSKMCVQHEPAAPVLFVCPNCNKQTNVASEHEAEDSCIVSGLKWTCEPAQPEPTTADRIAADLAAGTFRGVQPEPAAPRTCLWCQAPLKDGEHHAFKSDCTQPITVGIHADKSQSPPCGDLRWTGIADQKPEPAATVELPWPVRRAISKLREMKLPDCDGAADDLANCFSFNAAQPEPTTADRIAADLAAGTFRGVRPESAAPKGMAGVCFSIEGERWHEPGTCPHCTATAAPVEMPGAARKVYTKVESLLAALRWDLDRFPGQAILHFADQIDAAEREVRSSSQPAPVRMTEELETVLRKAELDAQYGDGRGYYGITTQVIEEIRAIAAVRAQAAEARAVKLPAELDTNGGA